MSLKQRKHEPAKAGNGGAPVGAGSEAARKVAARSLDFLSVLDDSIEKAEEIEKAGNGGAPVGKRCACW